MIFGLSDWLLWFLNDQPFFFFALPCTHPSTIVVKHAWHCIRVFLFLLAPDLSSFLLRLLTKGEKG
jgi:hypothetical protein